MTAPVVDAASDEGWVRLHPLTPLLRGGRFVLVAVAIVGQRGLREASLTSVAVALAVTVPVALLVGWVSWRAMRYRVTATELQVESGVLTKRSRRVPLARVQSVDVVRPLFARVLGLAEVRLEVVGGGSGAEAPLSYLTEEQAGALRTRLLVLAGGRLPGEAASTEPPERVLVVVPPRVLVGSTLLGPPLVTLVVLALAVLVAGAVDLSLVPGLLAAAAPGLLGVGSFAVRRILAEYDFSVSESADGLRLRQGLLSKRSSTIPPGRIQTVRLTEPLLWRRFGWVRVEVDVAGFSSGGGQEEQALTGVLLPVAPRDLAVRLVERVLGAPLPAPDRRPPPAARRRAPLSYRRLAYGLDDRHVVTTTGVFTTTTEVVPVAKAQSLRLTAGPFERRLGLASVHVDSAGRRLPGTVVRHRGRAEASALQADLAGRSRAARGR